MSDEIPFHIQEEIMKRLPVKSLLRFRSVSKPWKSLIDTSEFIAAHSLHRHKQPHHLLVSYQNQAADEDYVLFSLCYIDDDTFPKQRYAPTLPHSIKQLTLPIVVGSSQGLLCLIGSHPDFPTRMVVLWNPSIRKSILVDVPGEPFVDYGVCPFSGDPIGHSVGFGVCPVTSDPKIVAITRSSGIMVYTLSSGKWRSLSSTNLPTQPIPRLFCSVVTDCFIYWDVQLRDLKRIMSFDLTSESFDMIDLPDSLALARHEYRVGPMSKLRDSLALLEYGDGIDFSTVWIMEHGARITFTKLFTITTPHEYVVGFRMNDIPIMQVTVTDDDDFEGVNKLVVYQPNSEHNNVVDFHDLPYHFRVHSYMETLLLLGRSDYITDMSP